MKSPVVKRSVVIGGHKTSVSLEDAFWQGLKDIARARHSTLSDLIGAIDIERHVGSLSSSVRLFVLGHYRGQAPIASMIRSGASNGDGTPHTGATPSR